MDSDKHFIWAVAITVMVIAGCITACHLAKIVYQ